MNTFLAIDSSVLVAVIGGASTIVLALVVGIVVPLLNKIIAKQTEIRDGQIESHKQMNGLKDELLSTTKSLAEAVGYQRAQRELKQEQKESKIDPAQVEINRQEIEKLKNAVLPIAGIAIPPDTDPVKKNEDK